MKYDIAIGILLMLSLLGTCYLVYTNLPEVKVEITNINRVYKNVELKQDYSTEYYKLNLIEELAYNISTAREYKRGIYDCTEFSRDLWKALKKNNITSYCVMGVYKKGGLHDWVMVNDTDLGVIMVEATAGIIIDNDIYEEDYKALTIIKRGNCP